jgi:NADH-quinone oxidoreductase subunit N
MLTTDDFLALSPLILLAASSVIVMLLISLKLSHRTIQLCSLVLFAVSLASLFYVRDVVPYHVLPLLVIDKFSVFVMALILISGMVVSVFSYIYFDEKEESPKEYYVLLFLCTLGACILAISENFISLFLGLEILTVGLYALIAYLRGRHHNIEAGTKYLILAAFSSSFLLFGMALMYLQTGGMEFSTIASSLSKELELPPLFLTGFGMLLVGLGFKLAVVPFHMWTADVYQGAPTPVTAFIASASKVAVLAVLFRFLIQIDGFRFKLIMLIVICIAVASMLVGNLLSLQQRNVKRILAYSSIAHLGYLMVAFLPGNVMSIRAVSFYLSAYVITTLTAFGIMIVLSAKNDDAEDIESYNGLFWERPELACILTAALLSLAGIPLTAGFVGKFYILASGVAAGFWVIALVLVLSSVIGLYYYLRIITAMFSAKKRVLSKEPRQHPVFYMLSLMVLSGLTILIVWFGVAPAGLMHLVNDFMLAEVQITEKPKTGKSEKILIFTSKRKHMNKKVTGIGGVFFKCKDPENMKDWYSKNLGLPVDAYGANFEWRQAADPSKKGSTQWSPFPEDTKYFQPSQSDFMINYRVDDLETLVVQLVKDGVTVVDEIETYDYGKFVHILDPEGNKIELWEPVD